MSNLDASRFLNDLLAQKPQLQYSGTRKVKVTTCKEHLKSGIISCHTKEEDQPHSWLAPASVGATRVVNVHSVTYSEPRPTSIPELNLMTSKTVNNHSDSQVSSSISLGITGTESWSITKTRGVSTTVGGSLTLSGITLPIGSGSASVSFSQTASLSVAESETNSRSVTRSTNDTVTIGPRRQVRIVLKAFQSTAEIDFTAIVVLDADLQGNDSGVHSSSQMLTEAERTVPISGTIRFSAVSDASLLVEEVGKIPLNIEFPIETTEESVAFVGALGSTFKKRFAKLSDVARTDETILALPTLTLTTQPIGEEGPIIKVPDGTYSEVLYITEIIKPAFQCGFLDTGLPNPGVFSVEARQYSTYANGYLVRTWQEFVEVFKECRAP